LYRSATTRPAVSNAGNVACEEISHGGGRRGRLLPVLRSGGDRDASGRRTRAAPWIS
jgi:hypothetical protein